MKKTSFVTRVSFTFILENIYSPNNYLFTVSYHKTDKSQITNLKANKQVCLHICYPKQKYYVSF